MQVAVQAWNSSPLRPLDTFGQADWVDAAAYTVAGLDCWVMCPAYSQPDMQRSANVCYTRFAGSRAVTQIWKCSPVSTAGTCLPRVLQRG